MTNLQAPPSRVIAGSEATLALPLGELSPKVTERAWQALTDSPKAFPCSGRVLRDCHSPVGPHNDNSEMKEKVPKMGNRYPFCSKKLLAELY